MAGTFSVYVVTHLDSERVYVGFTKTTVENRWRRHTYDALVRQSNTHFHRAIRRYGVSAFKVCTIASELTHDVAVAGEIRLIAEKRSWDRRLGFNETYGGEGVIPTREVRVRESVAQRRQDPREIRELHNRMIQMINDGKLTHKEVALLMLMTGSQVRHTLHCHRERTCLMCFDDVRQPIDDSIVQLIRSKHSKSINGRQSFRRSV